MEPAKAYYRVLVIGFAFMLLANTLAMLVRAEGAIKESLLGNVLGTVINIVLDPILFWFLVWALEGPLWRQ